MSTTLGTASSVIMVQLKLEPNMIVITHLMMISKRIATPTPMPTTTCFMTASPTLLEQT